VTASNFTKCATPVTQSFENFRPAGTSGGGRPYDKDAFLMDSYTLMTPIDKNQTRNFWFQMRNFAPDDADGGAASWNASLLTNPFRVRRSGCVRHVTLRTFSKAQDLAGLRVVLAYYGRRFAASQGVDRDILECVKRAALITRW
jgi:hypothetical protein